MNETVMREGKRKKKFLLLHEAVMVRHDRVCLEISVKRDDI